MPLATSTLHRPDGATVDQIVKRLNGSRTPCALLLQAPQEEARPRCTVEKIEGRGAGSGSLEVSEAGRDQLGGPRSIARADYFIAACTEVKVVKLGPTPFSTVMMATEMPAAISLTRRASKARWNPSGYVLELISIGEVAHSSAHASAEE